MSSNNSHSDLNKLTLAGLLVTIGIIYGDIGTSPLYVMKAIMGENTPINALEVLGGISAVFWTLTLQTTIKYVWLTLQADNHGEGGVFSLYALVYRYRRKSPWLIFIAIIGGAALLADGIITPPISVASAIEGLLKINPNIPTVPIVIVIISMIFVFQRFGTNVVGRLFGPMMSLWFVMLAILGIINIADMPSILKALSPHYAIQLLLHHHEGFLVLGSVFLCTTGAEALYSDLGHCGKKNIRISWIFVKIALMLNYLGQGAYLISQEGTTLGKNNPFYEMMPSWFVIPGIIIASCAAIIASQALISGSFTLVGEAIRLNLLPKLQVNYPSNFKGQLYIPTVNTFLWVGCIGVVLYFRESTNMEAAYGMAITIAMLMTTILLANYLIIKRFSKFLVYLFLLVYIIVEGSFLAANLTKFFHGGFVTLIIGSIIIFLMVVWLRASKIKNRLIEYSKIQDYLDQLIALSKDQSVPKYATHLVYLSAVREEDSVESKIMYSILQKQPKRADIYWFAHIEVTDEPYTMEYKVRILAPDDAVRIDFRLGFRVQQRITLFLRQIIGEMIKKKEIDITSRYHSLREQNITGDFRFVLVEEVLSSDNELPASEQFVMSTYFWVKNFTASPEKWFGLDTSNVTIEKTPFVIRPATGINLVRTN